MPVSPLPHAQPVAVSTPCTEGTRRCAGSDELTRIPAAPSILATVTGNQVEGKCPSKRVPVERLSPSRLPAFPWSHLFPLKTAELPPKRAAYLYGKQFFPLVEAKENFCVLYSFASAPCIARDDKVFLVRWAQYSINVPKFTA